MNKKMHLDRRICIAPMIDYTNQHFRVFFRLLSKKVLLYTDMITTSAILNGQREKILSLLPEEGDVAFQVGGSEPQALAKVSHLIESAGFAEVNLNLGCPSPRVQKGAFGASLMKEKTLVQTCYEAIAASVSHIPATIKCRIGVDEFDSDDFFFDFIDMLYEAGCRIFIIHARIALLKGLSPKENRMIPPLNYERVFKLKARFADAKIILNGGLDDLEQYHEFCQSSPKVDGLMYGRLAIQNPYHFSQADNWLNDEKDKSTEISRESILQAYFEYFKMAFQQGANLSLLLKPLHGLYFGEKGTKAFKQRLLDITKATNPIDAFTKLCS